MKIISLFSGAGGLDLGLIQAGNKVIWANDIDKNAVETYKHNIGDHIILDDIKNRKPRGQTLWFYERQHCLRALY